MKKLQLYVRINPKQLAQIVASNKADYTTVHATALACVVFIWSQLS